MTGSESKATVTVLYFASLGDTLGVTQETLQLPEATCPLSALISLLTQRGSSWEKLANTTTHCAVNRALSQPDTLVKHGDEVAFFPPVTGG